MGDEDQELCDRGEHLDTEDGYCLVCGEFVLDLDPITSDDLAKMPLDQPTERNA